MKDLYQIAYDTVRPVKLKKNGEAGHVACALEAADGAVYTGICIDVPCSIGICAEQAAIAEMLKHGETKIRRIIAVYGRRQHPAALWKMPGADLAAGP